MAYLIPLFALFLSAVVFGSWQKKKSDCSASLNEKKLLANMPLPSKSFFHEILRIAAVKTGLIALFTIVSPRRSKVSSKTPVPKPEVAEALKLFVGIAANPNNVSIAVELLRELGSPLRWPMLYASEYYLHELQNNGVALENTWNLFVQGVIQLEGNASHAQAEPLLRKATENGFLPACAVLGDLYLSRRLWDKALQTVIPASEAFYPPAIHQHAYYIYLSTLGKLFQHRQMAEAFRLFSIAAEKGYPPSMATVGEMFLNGYGASAMPDSSTALFYLEQAYKAGEDGCLPFLQRARTATGEHYLDN